MGGYIQPFNFREIFINYFFGTTELFIFGFIIIISFLAAKYQMSNKIFLALLAVVSIIFANVLGESIYILIILIIGLLTFKGVARFVT